MKPTVRLIETEEEMQKAFEIRKTVFVQEQGVPAEEELDEHETIARHFLATVSGKPVGTARWRITQKGLKLERFAVLKEARGMNVGAALVQAVLNDLGNIPETDGKTAYMHAQTAAAGFYEKQGFQKNGSPFMECDIEHYLMIYLNKQP